MPTRARPCPLQVQIITPDGEPTPLLQTELDRRWLDKPMGKQRLENAVADLTLKALSEAPGSALVFLILIFQFRG